MRVLIVGAAGRDYHDFNAVFRGREEIDVVGFTQAPGQNLGELDETDRRYPSELAGEGYPDGIPIEPERRLETLVADHDVDQVVFSYSDVAHEHVMHLASRALAAGADFRIVGPDEMMLPTAVPVLAVDAVRTGCGKSQAAGAFADALDARGHEVRIVREPMPYGELAANRVQRFASHDDLDAAGVTIEEREEYEQHIDAGHVVFAGVDYEAVRDAAQSEADVIVWDGGNNELPFLRPDLHVVLADPLRAGDEVAYHPGEANLRRADRVIVNKENSAAAEAVETVVENVRSVAPDAEISHADSVVSVADPDRIAGASVLCIEDGPTLTHGDASRGAAAVAAERYGARERIDPTDAAVGSIADTLAEYPHLDRVLPAMGYSDAQIADLERTIRNADCDLVLAGTPHRLERQVSVDVPIAQVEYDVALHDTTFDALLDRHADAIGL
ncbi:GTPase [Halorubrum persicum]|uniref:GTPase n=1 Tax=Halorubrum persicum TaxID=1383844 RepID=UPI000C069070|nr:GTPase [Halorubrum persicum]